MSTPSIPSGAAPAPPRVLPAGWYPDPLNLALRRYFDGGRWTFWTSDPTRNPAQEHLQAATPQQTEPDRTRSAGLRGDIAAARADAKLLIGVEKEIRLLEGHLRQEERVVALAGAIGAGTGVLACTEHRLLFLFVGIVRKQFLEAQWNQVRHVIYDLASRRFEVYTVRKTKRAVPALSVLVPHREDAIRVAQAAEASSAAPRIDTV